MGRFVRKAMSIILLFVMINSVVLTSYAENVVNEEMILESTSISEEVIGSEEGETVETVEELDFIEETSSGQSINEYESEIKKKIDDIILNNEIELIEGIETTETSAKDTTSALESAISKIVNDKLEENDIIEASSSEINDEEFLIVATMNEVEELIFVEDNLFGTSLFGSGNHTSTASPSVVINSTYDRYEIYTGENEGVVRIFDNNGEYYNSDTNVKVIRDMADSNNNSPILLRLETNVSLFNFDNSNDNYVLLPEGFVEDLVARYSGNGYLNPQGINNLDHIRVDVTFNTSNLGNYDLFEYGVLYYLNCYEGVLGEYYYYDPSTTDIDRAASFYVNNKIMNRTYNIVSEYFYKSPSGEQLSFKPTWVLNSDSLIGANKETYAKQWVNFPYFLIKTGEKYWNLRESIEQSTYLSEYAEGYYEQYLTESPYGNVAERLVVLDDIYKTETDLLNDNTSNVAVHPYVKSNAIEITGNFREDNINDADKLRAGGVLPFDTYTVLNLNVTDHRAKSVQVYLNGEKLISNNNHGLYTLTNGKCQLRIDGSKLLSDENSRNVLSFILLNEEGNYLTDAQGRIINSYISLIRSSSINKETHRVHFVVNGGNNIPDINIEEGNRLGLPTNPVKEHYTFVAWYKDSNFTVRFDENEYIIGDIDLYALWRESDIEDLDILGAAERCINERVNGTSSNISANYNYRTSQGEMAVFKSRWEINNSNLTNGNKDNYVKQWINFPYFLIKTGEKYWEKRDEYNSVESLQGRIRVLDEIYKTEESVFSDATNGSHPFVRSNSIVITGNLRSDVYNDVNKMRSSAAIPYDVNTILNVKVSERNARSVQVYLNGEKLTSDNNNALYILKEEKCQIRIDTSKLLTEENSRNVVSFLLLDETGNYLTDTGGRLITNYISIIRNANIERVSYTVSFNTNGASYINDIKVVEGNRLSFPANPERYNFEFKGWYIDIECEKKFDENEYIISDKTLNALWGQSTQSSSRRYSGSGGGGGGGGGAAVTSFNMNNVLQGNNPLNGTKDAKSPSVKDAVSVRGTWANNGGKWQFSDSEGNQYKDRWAYIDISNDPNSRDQEWYRFDEKGDILVGYYFENDKVYYLDNGEKNKANIGKMLTGWHWLPSFDGGYCCYYFEVDGENKGVLVTDKETNDGYRVDVFGRWCDSGQVQRRNYN